MLCYFYGVLVQVLSERAVSGGIACDVRVVDPTTSPWTVSSFTTARSNLVPAAAVKVLS